MTPPRVRFAPSPTGQLHVGNARTALFNWLFARRHGGTFILRIEDTDVERSTRQFEEAMLADLRWLGLDWDEGPVTGGRCAPYRQSERGGHYASAAARLMAAGRAYYCFCSPDELEAGRQAALARGEAPKYDGRCRRRDPAESGRRVDAGERAAVRFAVPVGRDVTFTDIVRGEVTFGAAALGDPVMLRSDGRPAYNFAVVVDDAAMAITHVVRGEDHLSNTPRQLLMYEALDEPPPAFAHLSLVLGPDQAPLSKRHGATSVGEFRARGYLPDALVNYLALLGWSPGGDEEIVPLDEMARRFDLPAVGHSAAVFDLAKLAWVNRQYLKVTPFGEIAPRVLEYFERAGLLTGTAAAAAYLESLLPMVIASVDRLDELPERVSAIFHWDADQAAARLAAEPDPPRAAAAVAAFAREIAELGPLDQAAFRGAAGRVRQQLPLKGRALFHPIRLALTAADSGPELDLLVPAIDRGAALPREAVVAPIPSCAERARAVAGCIAGGTE